MKPTITILLCFITISSFAQAPKIQWEKCFGGTAEDQPQAIYQTADQGFIVAGYTWSNDKDVSGNHGYIDGWIIKLDSTGSLQWQKTYGGSGADGIKCFRLTSDGGYIFAATSYSNDGQVSGHHGSTIYPDVWVVKLDMSGEIQWENSYGGTDGEIPYDIQQTYDGGYIVAATTLSTDGDVTGQHGFFDYWIVKLDYQGVIEWENTFGGSGDDEPCSILQTADSGYVVAGYSTSDDGDITNHHGSTNNRDIWMIKIDKIGSLVGEKSLPCWQYETPYSMCFSNDSTYVIAGEVESYPKHGIFEHGRGDFGVIKVSKRGIIDTVCAMGGSQSDDAYSIGPTKDGGYIVTGQTFSSDGDVTGFHGFNDYWVVKLDSNLKMTWEETLGGSGPDIPYSIKQTYDGGYIVAGESDSHDGDVTGVHGGGDYWIVKLAPDHTASVVASTAPSNDSNKNLLLYPNPSNNEVNVSFPFSNNIITISDLLGRKLRQWKMESGKLKMVDVSFLQQGVYVIEIKDEKGVLIASEKLFKQ